MYSSRFLELKTLTDTSEDFDLFPLLERGLVYARQGLYHESIAIFHLILDHLSPDQHELLAILNQFLLLYTDYCQAQYVLQQASMRFVEANTAQCTCIEALAKLLPTLKNQFPLIKQTQTTQVSSVAQVSPARPISKTESLPALSVTCFGRFTISRLEHAITLCRNRNGQTLIRYLIAQSEYSATIDKLVHALWPEEEMNIALHKLRIAASALRRSLNEGFKCDSGGGYLLCRSRVYQLNPAVSLRSDVDDFLTLYSTGQKAEGDEAATYYEKACWFYTGPFLTEDIYADWSFFQREQLCRIYIFMCSSLASHYLATHHYANVVKWANAILKENKCDESAYQQLMRAYAAEGHRTEALRHYQRCQQVLDEELGMSPMPETIQLSQMIQEGTFSN